MTVGELVEVLSRFSPDTRIMVPARDTGWNELVALRVRSEAVRPTPEFCENPSGAVRQRDWWDGAFEQADAADPAAIPVVLLGDENRRRVKYQDTWVPG